jgi:hypothetical protein
MSSLIRLGRAIAKWVGLSTYSNDYALTRQAVLSGTSPSTSCGSSPTYETLNACCKGECLVTVPEASGASCTPTTPPPSSTVCDADYLRHKYGISKPMEDE